MLASPPAKSIWQELNERIRKPQLDIAPLSALPAWGKWKELMGDLEWLWRRLRDDESRGILAHLVLYHLNEGGRPLRWRGENIPWPTSLPAETNEASTIQTSFRGLQLHRRSLHGIGFPANLFLPASRPNDVFELQQYADPRHGLFVELDDVVIDGGGCWGDSAIYFSHLAGPNGRVFTFEFLPDNLKIMARNFAINPELAERIQIVENPLWSTEGKEMEFLCDGPATRLNSGGLSSDAHVRVKTITIDALVKSQNLSRVNFIKFDIEGAELEALRGAENTIRQFRPKMALCVYHCPTHFTQLARFVHEIHPDYNFSMDHFSNGPWETVLYAAPR